VFIDEAKIKVEAGRGGDGIVSFRREAKGRRFGKPDGGNGGAGGKVVLVCDERERTLAAFKRLKNFRAKDGTAGMSNRRTGKNGKDLILKVPCGTIVYQLRDLRSEIKGKKFPAFRKKVIDLKNINEKIVICKGGKGGFGNAHFCTATTRAPKKRTRGEPGEKKLLFLKIKLLADIGLIGLPNSGKSTLLSCLSRARPKIAEYPFTTLEPNLGIVSVLGKKFVVADIPGLIEGAYKGKGLGDKFLRHIERCQKLVHLIDVNSADVVRDYRTVRSELKSYSNKLLSKKEIVVLNKIDMASELEIKNQKSRLKKKFNLEPILISALTGEGKKELLAALIE